MITVKDNPSLVRDERSNSILNTNLEELKMFKLERLEQQKVHSLINEVDMLKTDVSEIKSLLFQILNKM